MHGTSKMNANSATTVHPFFFGDSIKQGERMCISKGSLGDHFPLPLLTYMYWFDELYFDLLPSARFIPPPFSNSLITFFVFLKLSEPHGLMLQPCFAGIWLVQE
jgi:hypothetical protein